MSSLKILPFDQSVYSTLILSFNGILDMVGFTSTFLLLVLYLSHPFFVRLLTLGVLYSFFLILLGVIWVVYLRSFFFLNVGIICYELLC